MPAARDQATCEQRGSLFVTTRWSIVRAANALDSSTARQALEKLCADYWQPVFHYFARSVGNQEQARDFTQAFFIDFLESRSYARATPDRGHFRSFLLGAAKYFLADEQKRANAQKRGGRLQFLQFDTVMADSSPSSQLPPDQQFDKDWALSVLERSLTRLREEYQLSGRGRLYDRLKGFLTGEEANSFADAARELSIAESAAKMMVTRMRQRFRAIARQELAETVGTQAELEVELQSFRQILVG